jgi:hypothetical protein
VALQHTLIVDAEHLEQPGRALEVGEHEGDRANRQIRRHDPIMRYDVRVVSAVHAATAKRPAAQLPLRRGRFAARVVPTPRKSTHDPEAPGSASLLSGEGLDLTVVSAEFSRCASAVLRNSGCEEGHRLQLCCLPEHDRCGSSSVGRAAAFQAPRPVRRALPGGALSVSDSVMRCHCDVGRKSAAWCCAA